VCHGLYSAPRLSRGPRAPPHPRERHILYLAYTLLIGLAFVAALPWFAWKGSRTGKYLPSLRERLGALPASLPRAARPSVWIHAVSVGEVIAARSLVAPLRAARPEVPIYLSTTTLTGHAIALGTVRGVEGVFYAPFDFPWPVDRALDRVRPGLLVLMETEIWPNLIHRARRRGARVAIANGRLSARSASRYARVRPLLRRVLDDVDLLLMQSEAFAERARHVGARTERVRVSGSIKYDAEPADPSPALRALLATGDPVIVAGSTLEGEEAAALEALRIVRASAPRTRLILGPRHPERFALVPALVAAAGFSCARRSELRAPWSADVLVLDSLGELAAVYALAQVAFVGGSLVSWGGHNVVEPAAVGVPVVVGPHMANFQDIADRFKAADALVEVQDAAGLGAAIAGLLADASRRHALGERGRALVEANRGALDRTVRALVELLP
jgi:3-deoxy-D-manno-octulosonic-acid transferase